jgi:hypothetical protein
LFDREAELSAPEPAADLPVVSVITGKMIEGAHAMEISGILF